MEPVYLDYNATTPIDSRVLDAMMPFLTDHFGNPSSGHPYGVATAKAIMDARAQLASLLGCHSDELIFTGGGTEANNMAILGIAMARRHQGNHIITSSVEHPAVIEVCKYLGNSGFIITYLPVDQFGLVSVEDVKQSIGPSTILITIMHANNETGTIQPIREIGELAREKAVVFHTDAAQSVGKIQVKVDELMVDLLSVAGHKLYAPKGVGALYLRRGTKLQKVMFGANHEADRRPGTENVAGVVGLGKAAEIIAATSLAPSPLLPLRDRLYEGIREHLPEVHLNGHPEMRLPNTLSLGFPGVEATLLLQAMEDEVAVSAGAACHTGDETASGVLTAMKVPEIFAMGTLRFSVGRMTTLEEIERVIPVIVKRYQEVRGSEEKAGTENHYTRTTGGDQKEKDPPSPIAHRPSPITHRPSPIAHRPSPIAHRLTSFTHALGCACKIRPQMLEKVLREIPPLTDKRVLVGTETADDASVYQLDEIQALVQTVDFIPPLVDDPYAYGAIAAANAISDVYAMGAQPLYALNIVGFPEKRLPEEVLQAILKGGHDKAAEAGIPIVGGHSIESTEPVYGMSVTGVVHPGNIIRNRGVKPGDVLLLTKPIGSGILTTTLKRGLLSPAFIQPLIGHLSNLNRSAAEVMRDYAVHACTDITGFGLLGHLFEMIRETDVDVEVWQKSVPLMEGVRESIGQGIIPGGTKNNLNYVEGAVKWASGIPDQEKLILCDAQTSGGLLIALPASEGESIIRELHRRGLAMAAIIGEAKEGVGNIWVS